MLAVHHWLLPSLHVFIVVLAALLGLLWAPWGWLVRRLLGGRGRHRRRVRAARWSLVPSGWLMVELVALLAGSRRPVGAAGRQPVAGARPRCGSPRSAGCGWSALLVVRGQHRR